MSVVDEIINCRPREIPQGSNEHIKWMTNTLNSSGEFLSPEDVLRLVRSLPCMKQLYPEGNEYTSRYVHQCYLASEILEIDPVEAMLRGTHQMEDEAREAFALKKQLLHTIRTHSGRDTAS